MSPSEPRQRHTTTLCRSAPAQSKAAPKVELWRRRRSLDHIYRPASTKQEYKPDSLSWRLWRFNCGACVAAILLIETTHRATGSRGTLAKVITLSTRPYCFHTPSYTARVSTNGISTAGRSMAEEAGFAQLLFLCTSRSCLRSLPPFPPCTQAGAT